MPSPTATVGEGLALPVRAIKLGAANYDFGWCLIDANQRVLAPYLTQKQAMQMSAAINCDGLSEAPSAQSENSLSTREQFILAFIKTCAGPAFDREEIRAEANHILAGKLVYAKEAGRDRI